MAVSFALTEEQEELRAVVRRFAQEEIAPRAEEFNRLGEFPVDLVRRMGEMGLFGITLPSEYGGMDGDLLSLCVAIEEIGRVDQSLGVTLEAGVGLGAVPIARYGTEEQKARWLPRLATGEVLAGFALTEPGGGTDTASLRTTARREGDAWVLNGSKQFITNAGTELSAFVTVAARTDEGITAFIVERDTPGFTIGQGYHKVGWHASDTRDLSFDECRVPAANQVGELGRGLAAFLSILQEGRIALAALATGLLQACVDECVRYAGEREAFGQPIGAHQAIAFKIADMKVAADLARLAYYRAAWLHARGEPFGTAASIAKLYASEQAVTQVREAAQVFGGYGFTTEYLIGRLYQDAKILEVGEGTSEVQRMLIARALGLPRPAGTGS